MDRVQGQDMYQYYIIGKLDIFPLMCAADELTLIHKNIRSVTCMRVYWSI